MLLKGNIYITSNKAIIDNTDLNLNKVVLLDEEGIIENPPRDFIGGTCLLPPIQARIAEIDGDEEKYDMIYSDYLLQPFQQQFISAIISFLYKGGNLILFLPDFGYNNTIKKLIQHMHIIYGIHIGNIDVQDPVQANCYYDERCTPIWLNLIFMADVMTPEEYLYNYPIDAAITTDAVRNKLLDLMKPMGDTIEERMKTIETYRARLKVVPKLIIPIRRIR